MYRTVLTTSALALSLIGLSERPASAQLMPTAQVANLIAKSGARVWRAAGGDLTSTFERCSNPSPFY